jgi:hypothetical protein
VEDALPFMSILPLVLYTVLVGVLLCLAAFQLVQLFRFQKTDAHQFIARKIFYALIIIAITCKWSCRLLFLSVPLG